MYYHKHRDHPAPGYRYADSGEPVYVGNCGCSWASEVSDANGMRLNFNVTWLASDGASNRVYGFQLRCLSE